MAPRFFSKKKKRENFYQLLPKYLENYPNEISKIPSLQDFADMTKVERNTIIDWLKKYFRSEYGSEVGTIRFREIRSNRQGGQDVR